MIFLFKPKESFFAKISGLYLPEKNNENLK